MVQGVTMEERVALSELLYAELMVAILKVLGRLDLGSQREEDMVSTLNIFKRLGFILYIHIYDYCYCYCTFTKNYLITSG